MELNVYEVVMSLVLITIIIISTVTLKIYIVRRLLFSTYGRHSIYFFVVQIKYKYILKIRF